MVKNMHRYWRAGPRDSRMQRLSRGDALLPKLADITQLLRTKVKANYCGTLVFRDGLPTGKETRLLPRGRISWSRDKSRDGGHDRRWIRESARLWRVQSTDVTEGNFLVDFYSILVENARKSMQQCTIVTAEYCRTGAVPSIIRFNLN